MEQSEQITDLLYDFIYIDDHKSKILLAQLESNGILTQIKNKYQEEDTNSGEAGVNKIVVAKKIGSTSQSEAVEHSFDTSLSIHLSLLHKLSEHNQIKHDITKSKIGDIVLFNGSVSVLDISTIQKLASSVHLFLDSKKGKSDKQVEAIIKALPSQIQFTFLNDENQRAWMTLSDKNMLISSSDLMLKYGSNLDGEWSVIGILDSTPSNDIDITASADNREMATNFASISTQFKKMMGRDPSYFGITPLMIFRKINLS